MFKTQGWFWLGHLTCRDRIFGHRFARVCFGRIVGPHCDTTNNHHGSRGVMRNVFGNAAQEQAIHAASSVRSQNDQVGFEFVRRLDDHIADAFTVGRNPRSVNADGFGWISLESCKCRRKNCLTFSLEFLLVLLKVDHWRVLVSSVRVHRRDVRGDVDHLKARAKCRRLIVRGGKCEVALWTAIDRHENPLEPEWRA